MLTIGPTGTIYLAVAPQREQCVLPTPKYRALSFLPPLTLGQREGVMSADAYEFDNS